MLCCDITHQAGHYKLFVFLYQHIFVIPMYTIFFVSTYLRSLISLGLNSISLCLCIFVLMSHPVLVYFLFVYQHICVHTYNTLFLQRHFCLCSCPVYRCRLFVSTSSATARHETKRSCDVHAITVLVLVFAMIGSLTESLCVSVHAHSLHSKCRGTSVLSRNL